MSSNEQTLRIKVDASEVKAVIKAAIAEVQPFNYQAEAQQTKSDQFHGNLVAEITLADCLMESIQALQLLDAVKKTLFYGKENKFITPSQHYKSCESVIFSFPDPIKAIDIIHSIIGKATEAGELLELLYATIFQGAKFDVTNFKEEIGDGLWYDAVGLEAVGSNFSEVQKTNIAKLRARFPNKFSEYDANNRDLFLEREILEK